MVPANKKPKLDWLRPDFFDFLADSRILMFLLQIVFYQRKKELIGLLEQSGFIAALRTTIFINSKRNKLLVYANNFHQAFFSNGIYEILRGYAFGLDFSQFVAFKKFAKTNDNYQNQLIVFATICNKFRQEPTDIAIVIRNYISSTKAKKPPIIENKTREKNDIPSIKKPAFMERIISIVKSGMAYLLFNG